MVALAQAAITIVLARVFLSVPIQTSHLPLAIVTVLVGTAAWFFFYATFALVIRQNDVFNTVTSIFYFVFLFASSMFYPIEPLPPVFRHLAAANPITWHVDVLRYATIGLGEPATLIRESALCIAFTVASFGAALWALGRE